LHICRIIVALPTLRGSCCYVHRPIDGPVCMAGLDAWHLTAAEFLASACRSVLLGLAVLHVRPMLCLHCMRRLAVLHDPLAGLFAMSNPAAARNSLR